MSKYHMNENLSVDAPRSDRWWPAYLKTAILVLPSVLFFGVAVVFVFPKIKQICADTNYDARYLFRPVDVLVENFWLALLGVVLLLAGLERVRIWRRYRAAVLGLGVFVVHTAVLLGLVASLVVVAMVAPALSKHF